jgi:predicted ATP-dependent endonuclease of OLD family
MEGLKVLDIAIQNFKNISKREVEFDGKSALLIGPNRIGKSSFIQAIQSPLDAKYIPLEPVKQGEEKGRIELTIGGVLNGDELKYTIVYQFSSESSRGKIAVKNAEGETVNGGRELIQSIIGNIGFDIFEFIRKGRTPQGKLSTSGVREQIEILKSLMPKDIIVKMYQLDQEKEKVYKERTQINSEVSYLKGVIKNSPYTPEDIEKYSKPLSAEEITEQIQKGTKRNQSIARAKEVLDVYPKTIEQSKNLIDEMKKKIKHLEELIGQEEQRILDSSKRIEEAQNWLEGKKEVDLTELNESFNKIGQHNMHHQKVLAIREQEKELREKEKIADSKTQRLQEIEAEKKSLFTSDALPIPGLAFDEEKITYNGLPLSEDQLPTSQLIHVGLKIGMAMNPNLRLLIIRDGSLLDEDTLNEILRVCDEQNYQVIIEIVDKREGEEPTIEFVER